MKVMKIALLGTAALVAASISARAENLDALKAAMNDLTIGAVADAPAAAAPATTVTWEGRVRAGLGVAYDPRGAAAGAPIPVPGFGGAGVGAGNNQTAVDFRAIGRIAVTGKTQTAVGEVGVSIALQGAAGSNTAGIANGNNGGGAINGGALAVGSGWVRTDGVLGYWKMTPALTLSAGQLGCLCTAYSWDANTGGNYFFSSSASILGMKSSADDPVGFRLAYADGPLGFSAQVYDGVNALNTSYFGAGAKASYKIDAFGVDFGGSYNGLPPGAAWSVYGGLGYSAGAFGFGASLATGNNNGTATGGVTPGSAYMKLALSDQANFQVGVTREFQAAGNNTVFGATMYYSPVKQLTFGIEGNFVSNGLGAAAGDGSYGFGLVSAFTF